MEKVTKKAVIMAGGEGKRLKSVTGDLPKPMVPLLGRPLMARCVDWLASQGFTELCATLRYNPGPIMDYFGDGEDFGVHISWRVETRPLGTAGGVKACMDLLGGGDFVVVSGDAACDFDLNRLVAEHRASGAAVTVALAENPSPLRYGIAVPDAKGDIRCFIEKPDWGRVVSDLVSTGIYAVSPRAMEPVPDSGSFDFAADLFPALLARGERIHGARLPGYWCDVGTPGSYYRCCVDALEGRLRLPGIAPPEGEAAPPPRPGLRGGARAERRVESADAARLMRFASAALMDCGADFSDGLTVSGTGCSLRLSPEPGGGAVTVETAARDGEFASELAVALEDLLRGLENNPAPAD